MKSRAAFVSADIPKRRGDRAVEGARLEIVCTPNKGTGGSNPPLSAILTACICAISISSSSLGFGEGFGFAAFRAASPNPWFPPIHLP